MPGEDPATCPPSPFSDRRSSSGDTVNSQSFFSSTSSHVAMAKLEDDFRNILLTKSNDVEVNSLVGLTSSLSIDRRSCDGEYSEEGNQSPRELGEDSSTRSSISRRSIKEIDLFSLDSVAELRSIADQMISSGHGREIVQVYCSARRSSIDLNLKNLGVEKMSIGDVQKLEWDVTENKIRRWIRAAKVCVRVIFASENNLCNSIFELDENDKNNNKTNINPFFDTVKGAAVHLFGFPDAISIGRRSPEKIFKILDLHDAISELLPDVAEIFGSRACESIHSHVTEILARLVEAVRGILSEFENAVVNEPSTVPVPGGTVHPLTRYVMNYITLLSDYKQTLIELIVNKPPGMAKLMVDNPNAADGGALDIGLSEMENQPPLALHMIWIIAILQFNLESKASLYKDSSLAYFFMMNNVYYIVHKVKESQELRELISDDYLRKLTRKFRQDATSYQRATWIRILDCLKEQGIHVTGSFSSGVSKSTLRERFKSFNALFDEAHRTQATWYVPDVQLREELQISICEKLLPAYRSFLGRFRHHIEHGRHPEMYIKYSVDDLENALIDFFEGCQPNLTGRRRSSH